MADRLMWNRIVVMAAVVGLFGDNGVWAAKPSAGLDPLKLNIEFYWDLQSDQHYVERFVAWEFPVDSRIAAFHVYELLPGAATYEVYHTVQVSGAGGSYDVLKTPDRWMYVRYGDSWWSTPGWGWVQVWDRRNPVTAYWPVGGYKIYVVAVDAQGKALTKSPTLLSTVFGPMTAQRPTEGAVVEPLPTLVWDGVLPAPSSKQARCFQGVYQPQVYDLDKGGPGWSKNVPLGQTSLVYDGLPLTPGHRLKYSLVTYVSDTCREQTVGVGIGVMPAGVNFTVE
jgi:hypothetical protein